MQLVLEYFNCIFVFPLLLHQRNARVTARQESGNGGGDMLLATDERNIKADFV